MILKTTDEILGALERGDLSRDYAEALREAGEALANAGEGSATVTLKLKMTAKDEAVAIKTTITKSLPEKKRRTTTLFLTGDGRLSNQHPDQVELFESRERTPGLRQPA